MTTHDSGSARPPALDAEPAPVPDPLPDASSASVTDPGLPVVPAEPPVVEHERVTPPQQAHPATRAKQATLGHSRFGGLWTGLILSAVVLLFLLIFILQNLDQVQINFLGLSGILPVGVAMLLAAIAGLLLVAIPGGVRILQLRRAARKGMRRTV